MAYLSQTWTTVILEGTIERYEQRVSKSGNPFGTGTLRCNKKHVKGQEVDPKDKLAFIQFSVFRATELEVFALWDQRYPPTQGQYGPRKQAITIAGVIEVKPASGNYAESEAIIVNHAGLMPEVLSSIQSEWAAKPGNSAAISPSSQQQPTTYAGNAGARQQANQARQQYQVTPPPSAGRLPYSDPPAQQAYIPPSTQFVPASEQDDPFAYD
jgi:hypothetical protein